MTEHVRRLSCLLTLVISGCSTPPAAFDASTDDAGTDAWSLPDAWIDPCSGVGGAYVQTVGMLSTGRYAPAVARLSDGRILIAGGFDYTTATTTTSAELYDPVARTLSPTGPLLIGRNFASATAVEGGVLVIGGFNDVSGSVGAIERYDETSGTFIPSNVALAFPREAHTATLLDDGHVLIAGGLRALGLQFQSSLELYDPAADTIRTASSALVPPRGFHDAVFLESRGAVLLVGGDSGMGELATAVRWSIGSDVIDAAHSDRAHAGKAVAAALLPNGRVIVAGGANAIDGTLADVDEYDPSTDRFTPVASMSTRRMAHTLTALGDGRLVAIGGWSDSEVAPGGGAEATGSIEVRAQDGSWMRLALNLAVPRLDHRAIAIDACHVVVIGGQHAASGASPSAPREIELITIPR
jgi:hypothetical protein